MKGISAALNWAIILRSQKRYSDAQQFLEKMLGILIFYFHVCFFFFKFNLIF